MLMAATNVLSAVDPALLRPGRFDRQLFVPPPDGEARRAIFRMQRGRMQCWGEGEAGTKADAILERLVLRSEGLTGADVVNVCQHAALLALAETERAADTTGRSADSGEPPSLGLKIVVREAHLDCALDEALVILDT